MLVASINPEVDEKYCVRHFNDLGTVGQLIYFRSLVLFLVK